jgi:mono/diheme cytochrome c family protein
MQWSWRAVLLAAGFISISLGALYLAVGSRAQSGSAPSSALLLHGTRSSPLDLEIGGELSGLRAGETGYLTRNQLLAWPQVAYTVSDDANFTGPTKLSGVPLEELSKRLGVASESDVVLAICGDKYLASYPPTYVAAHHPLLVLAINGQPPSGWPKDSEGHGLDMGPYLISHPNFAQSSKFASPSDEPQIPWGVVRLEFRDSKTVFGGIAPVGAKAQQALIQTGYHIARQNCFRCHNLDDQGGQKAGRTWLVLAAWASASPERFAGYVRDPKSKNPRAEMPANPAYDDAALGALTAYFQAFAAKDSAKEKP